MIFIKTLPCLNFYWQHLFFIDILYFCYVIYSCFFSGIGDPRHYLVLNLAKLAAGQPGRVPGLVQQLPEQARQFLQQYVQQAGVTIQ